MDRIRVPTLLMAGDRDLLVSAESLTDLGDGIADSRIVRLEGSGHLAFVTQPEHVAREVRAFFV
jgi:pimeloyl-ACP methyl ester carboxylesterase